MAMHDTQENAWLDLLAREAGIRKALIVHGNLLDLFYWPEEQRYVPLSELLPRLLKRRGYRLVVIWDRFSGVRGVTAQEWNQLARAVTQATAPARPAAARSYDLGGQTPQPQAPAADAPKPSPDDFFAVVHHYLIRPLREQGEPVAFVADWTNYLFGNANALSEQERQWLLIINRSLVSAPVELADLNSMPKNHHLLILLCPRLTGIPPVLYTDNPAIKEISIPWPGRTERQRLLERTITAWRISNRPAVGQVAFAEFVDSLEGLSLRDLLQMLRLSQQTNEPLTAERLINLYRYGEQRSPWEDLSYERLSTPEDTLRERVKGQDEAIEKVASVIKRAYTGLAGLQHSKKQRMPKGTLFFVGPTGVGKTELAKSLAQFLFGDEEACIRFDMSEFNHEHSDQRLVGAPPGYVGYEEGGQLTNAVKKRPFSVLLFDEIEKAHVRILDKFLQILEDGRLTDGKGETVHFSETVIIFTSNIGAAEVQFSEDKTSVREEFIEKVKRHFIEVAGRPELLNRLGDNVVPFNFIADPGVLINIARTKLRPLRERLREKYYIADLVFDNEEKALGSIVQLVDRRMGGRGVLNQLNERLLTPLSQWLFENSRQRSRLANRTIRVLQVGSLPEFEFDLE